MRLLKISFIESQGSSEQYISPFESHVKKRDYDRLAEATDGATNFSASRLARIAHDIMAPSTEVLRSNITGGWNEKRIMFAMVVEVANRDKSMSYEYIVGTTDHSDYSEINGRKVKFDKKMKMYFTSITKVNMSEGHGRRGSIWTPSIKTHDQVLHRSAVTGDRRRMDNGDLAVSMRPTDVFRRRKGSEHFFGGSDRDVGDYGADDTLMSNLCGTFNEPMKLANLNNTTLSGHLSKSLSSYAESANMSNGSYMDDMDDSDGVIRNACDISDENVIDDDAFIQHVMRDSNILNSGYIMYGELMDANPDFNEDDVVFLPIKHNKNLTRTHGRSNWNDATSQAIAANIIKNTLPALMINAMYSIVDVVINSRARFGEDKVLVTYANPFLPGLEVNTTRNYFEGTIENVLLPELTHNGVMDVEARIIANIDGEMEIYVSIDNEPEEYFVAPVFAGSFASPLLGSSGRQIDNLTKGIVDLAEALSTRRSANFGTKERPAIDTAGDITSVRRERTAEPSGRREYGASRDRTDSTTNSRGYGR